MLQENRFTNEGCKCLLGFQNLKSENGMKLYSSIFIAAAAVIILFESSVHARSVFQSANHSKLSQEKTFFDHSSNAKTKLQKRQAKKFMRLYDLNHDGRVTVDEIIEDHRRMLQAIDIDDSQGLAPKEMRRRGSNLKLWKSVTIFDLLDDNGNQEITALELSRPAQRWFKRHDLNDDGVLKKSEIFIHLKRGKKAKKQRRRFKNFIKFCDLNWENDCLNFNKKANPIKTVSIAQARKPIYKSSINNYENYSNYLDMFKKIDEFKGE